MKNISRKPWFRILPIVVLIIFLLVDILRLFTPSGGAAGTGFSTYHDNYYGYSINYPSNWKITHIPAHSTEFVAPGSPATCQVSINVTREAMIPQKALLSVVPRAAYSISHKTIDGSQAIAFSQYSSRVQDPDGNFTSASTKKVVVAQVNTAHGVNLYSLALDMYRAAFVHSKNVEPHAACESNFQVMTNSLKRTTEANGLANAAPGVMQDPTNPAIIYADTHWSWTYYNHLSGDSHSYYCTGYNETTLQCNPPPNLLGTDTPDTGKFDPGYFQPQFQCAEFVARALAKEGFMPFLDPLNSTPNDFANYQGYDLLSVDSLYKYLLKIGGVDIGDNPAGAAPGDVVFYPQHVSLLIETGTTQGGRIPLLMLIIKMLIGKDIH